MVSDVPAQVFFDQIGNTTVRAVLTSNTTLPSTITPSAFLLALIDGLDKAQVIFNSENGSLPNVGTVSSKELGLATTNPDGSIQLSVFYTVGGNLLVDFVDSNPIIL